MTVPPNMLASIGIAFGAWFTARTGHRPLHHRFSRRDYFWYDSQQLFLSLFKPLAGYIILLATKTRTLSLW